MIVICEDVFVFFCFFSFINDWFNEEVFIFWIYLGGISGEYFVGGGEKFSCFFWNLVFCKFL